MKIPTPILPLLLTAAILSCRSSGSGSYGADDMSGASDSPATMAMSQGSGSEADVEFARDLWKEIEGYEDWRMISDVYPGRSPHGDFLRMAASFVTVQDKSYPVIVKDNFAGKEAEVRAMPTDHLAAVTVMLRRMPGYDPEHLDWFYVKYSPEGEVLKGPDDTSLAGRVTSCVECHDRAGGHDYLFHND